MFFPVFQISIENRFASLVTSFLKCVISKAINACSSSRLNSNAKEQGRYFQLYNMLTGILEEKMNLIKFSPHVLLEHHKATWKFAVKRYPAHLHAFPLQIHLGIYKLKAPILKLIIQKQLTFHSTHTPDRDGYNWWVTRPLIPWAVYVFEHIQILNGSRWEGHVSFML